MRADEEGIVTEADVRAAQTLLDAFLEVLMVRKGIVPVVLTADALELRGMLAAHNANVRTAGYLEGEQAGRRQVGHLVLERLAEEGLVPAFVAPKPGAGW